jgi:type IV pilus assembly protein PilV
MGALNLTTSPRAQQGALMIEILVTIAIIIVGVLGILQMQSRLQKSEVEAYQRTQALILLHDISSRMTTNRGDVASYVTTGPPSTLSPAFLGGTPDVDWDCSSIGTGTLQETDFTQWCEALQGAAETQSGSSVGAMLGGRGCVEQLDATIGLYMLTVVWQGLTPISAPPASVTCGYSAPPNNPYDGDAASGSTCLNDLCRRYVTTMIRVRGLPTP